MILLNDTLISEEIIENQFVCNLDKCKGACCVQGDRGAPIDDNDRLSIEKNFNSIKSFMNPEFLKDVESNGFYEIDDDGEMVTTCQPTGECNFVVYQNGMAACAIENAYAAGMSDYKKPISCHLYPARVKKLSEYTVVNYHNWHICSDACQLGAELKVPVYQFLKEPLIRKFGQEWFDELSQIAESLKNQ